MMFKLPFFNLMGSGRQALSFPNFPKFIFVEYLLYNSQGYHMLLVGGESKDKNCWLR